MQEKSVISPSSYQKGTIFSEDLLGEKPSFRPCIVALVGLPLTGKSTLGYYLGKFSNLVFLDSDDVRTQIFERTTPRLPPDQEMFAKLVSYQKTHEIAMEHIQRQEPVAIEGTYSRKIYHEMLKRLARKAKVPLRVFLLESTDETIRRRLMIRNNENTNRSNLATVDDLQEIKARYEPLTDIWMITINSNQPMKVKIATIFKYLNDLLQ